MTECRLLRDEVADGPENMAGDEVLLESAVRGVATLRFYAWSVPTVSLGYFQPASIRAADPHLAGLPFVRRPSGGATLVHDYEITYALALPRAANWQSGEPWLQRMHGIIAKALTVMGVAAQLHIAEPGQSFSGHLCFQHWSAGDLIVNAAKITGSAQRKQRGALLQHGAILIARSPHAPTLPGLHDLTGLFLSAGTLRETILRQFRQETGWRIRPGDWDKNEVARREDLVMCRYDTASWNEKR
jgi:lipoate-protein ligase A